MNYDYKTQDGVFKVGEMAIFYSGRQIGKTIEVNNLCREMISEFKFEILGILGQAEVDGETWYSISVNREIASWLRDQPKEWQHELTHGWYDSQFDIHEQLYTLLILRWS